MSTEAAASERRKVRAVRRTTATARQAAVSGPAGAKDANAAPASKGGAKDAAAVLAATRGKVFDVVGNPRAAAAEVRTYFAELKEVLPYVPADIASFNALLGTCEHLQKCMRFLPDQDLSKELAEMHEIQEKAKEWQRQVAGNPEAGQHLFPFAAKTFRSFNDLARCVDQLQRIYGKELDDMGIHLPMIVAVGNESAGKSSVMEMIAGQPFFPRHEGTCTRLPFRLQFRCSGAPSVSFQGLPNSRCNSPAEVQDRIAAITKERTNNKDVSTEEVVLNIDMGDVPELTLVDLPGLIGTTYASEGRDLKEKVRNLVTSYVKQPHAIILAVAAANTRLRDSEVFGLVKELGAEDRTIGLLTKCDLATDKRWKLEEKIGHRLQESSPEEQEKAGFIPLRRGYYGMICRDTENTDRPTELSQTQEAIERVKAREAAAFDEILRDPGARARCGVDKVYSALSTMFTEYIQTTWRPDTMRKLEEKIRNTKREIADLCFSERYTDPPSSDSSSTTKYKQEVEDRFWRFSRQFDALTNSFDLSDRLLAQLPKSAPECTAVASYTSDRSKYFSTSLQPLADQIKDSLKKVQHEVQSSINLLLKEHKSTKHLPVLCSFILTQVMQQVTAWVGQEIDTLAVLIAINGVQPLPQQGPLRVEVPVEIQSVALSMSQENECSVCHESMLSGRPLDLVRCCSKHFHRHCLDEVQKSLRTSAQALRCPLCRSQLETCQTEKDDKSQLQDVGERLSEHARRAVAALVYKLRGLRLGHELERAANRPAGAKNLLDELPELQLRRRLLRQNLAVLQQVEMEVNTWADL